MPKIGAFHPQVVHFVIASLFIGLPIYWLSFVPRLKLLRVMALILLAILTSGFNASLRRTWKKIADQIAAGCPTCPKS